MRHRIAIIGTGLCCLLLSACIGNGAGRGSPSMRVSQITRPTNQNTATGVITTTNGSPSVGTIQPMGFVPDPRQMDQHQGMAPTPMMNPYQLQKLHFHKPAGLPEPPPTYVMQGPEPREIPQILENEPPAFPTETQPQPVQVEPQTQLYVPPQLSVQQPQVEPNHVEPVLMNPVPPESKTTLPQPNMVPVPSQNSQPVVPSTPQVVQPLIAPEWPSTHSTPKNNPLRNVGSLSTVPPKMQPTTNAETSNPAPQPLVQPQIQPQAQESNIKIPPAETLKSDHPPQVNTQPNNPLLSDTVLVQAIRAYQEKRPDQAIELLKSYDPANQELLLYMMPMLVRLAEGNISTMTPEELAAFLDRLQGVNSILKNKAALRMDTVCFCSKIEKYGKYDALDPQHIFQQGEQARVYAELRNFTWKPVVSKTSNRKEFAMNVQSTLEIRDVTGKLVWRDTKNTDDTRQTPQMDYFLTYSFCIPETAPGAYTLSIQVLDYATGRTVRRTLDLRVGNR